jgi:hypothetical protein
MSSSCGFLVGRSQASIAWRTKTSEKVILRAFLGAAVNQVIVELAKEMLDRRGVRPVIRRRSSLLTPLELDSSSERERMQMEVDDVARASPPRGSHAGLVKEGEIRSGENQDHAVQLPGVREGLDAAGVRLDGRGRRSEDVSKSGELGTRPLFFPRPERMSENAGC